MQLNSITSNEQSLLPKKKDLVSGDTLSFRMLPSEILLRIGGYMIEKKDFSSFSRIEVITSVLRRDCFKHHPLLVKQALEAYDFDMVKVPQELMGDIKELRTCTFVVDEEITSDELIMLMKCCPRITTMNLILSSTVQNSDWLALLAPYCTRLKEVTLTGDCGVAATSLAALVRCTPSLEKLHLQHLVLGGEEFYSVQLSCVREFVIEAITFSFDREEQRKQYEKINSMLATMPHLTHLSLPIITTIGLAHLSECRLRKLVFEQCYQVKAYKVEEEKKALGAFFTKQPLLEVLHMRDLAVDTDLCGALSTLTCLKELSIGEASLLLDDDIALLPPTLRVLELLCWESTQMTVLTTHLKNVDSLSLSSCSKITEKDFESLKKLSLKTLSVYDCPGFGRDALDAILSMPTLRFLQVQFTTPFYQVNTRRDTSVLKILVLDMEHVTEEMLYHFVERCSFLEELTLENVHSSTGLQRIKELKHLKKCIIGSCEDSISEELGAELEELEKSFASLHIKMPEIVERLDLSAIYEGEVRNYRLQHQDTMCSKGRVVASLILGLIACGVIHFSGHLTSNQT